MALEGVKKGLVTFYHAKRIAVEITIPIAIPAATSYPIESRSRSRYGGYA